MRILAKQEYLRDIFAIVRTLVLAAGICLSAGASFQIHAQSDRGRIVGTVRDSTRAVLPRVSISATNLGTGFRTRAVSSDSGTYALPYLPAGTFRITAELSGFKTHVRGRVVLQVAQTLRQDITLELGELSETIEISPERVLQSETSTAATVIDNHQVVELPLNGRSFTELTVLVPGAVPNPNPTFLTSGTNVSVSGTRSENNNFTLDGVNNNETFFKQFAVQPSLDAIQEFAIQTNVASAEYGSGAGSQINVITKSGGETFHGSLFEFVRNDLFDARDAFAKDKPNFRQNQFGATISGPLAIPRVIPATHNTYFMVNYEGFRFRRDSSIYSTVPTAAMLSGDLSHDVTGKPAAPIYDPLTLRPDPSRPGAWIRDPFPQNVIPKNRIDPIASSFMRSDFCLNRTCRASRRTWSTANLERMTPIRSRFGSITRLARNTRCSVDSPGRFQGDSSRPVADRRQHARELLSKSGFEWHSCLESVDDLRPQAGLPQK